MVFIEAIEGILSIIIMIAVGYWLAAKGWFNTDNSRLLSKLVTHVSLPSMMIWNLTESFNREKLSELSYGLTVPLLTVLGGCLIGIVMAKLIHVPKNRQGVFISGCFAFNTIFVGLPVNMALFGPESMPYVLLFYIANTVTYWTLGTYYISRDGKFASQKIISLATLKSFFPPPMLGFLAGILLVILEIKLPSFVVDTCKYLGNMTTPLAMLFIGIAIHAVDPKELRLSKDMLAMFTGRFVLCPGIVILLNFVLPMPDLMKKVFVMQAGMPMMTQTAIVAAVYGADAKYAAVLTVATTLLAMVAIPIYMVLLQ